MVPYVKKNVTEFFFIYNNYIIINQNYVRDNNHLDRKRDLDLRFEWISLFSLDL